MELLTIFLRTVFIYFAVFIVMRIMGKREIGKLSVFDLVISIMIAEIAVFVIEDIKRPLAEGLVPIATLVVIQIGIAFVSLKNQTIRKWFDGPPSIIIEKGKINRDEMRKQRYNLDDLMIQLRQSNVTNVADVEFAILETTGKLTVLRKEDSGTAAEKPGELGDLPDKDKPQFRYEGLPLPLIMDGKVQDDNLQKIEKTRFWLKNQIQAKGISEFKDIFFCSIDHRGNLFVDRKRRG